MFLYDVCVFIGALIKGISGGQRKRTSIGIEIITDPVLLFLVCWNVIMLYIYQT